MAKTNFKTLQLKYKTLLNDAYQLASTNQIESERLYAEADKLRKTLYAF